MRLNLTLLLLLCCLIAQAQKVSPENRIVVLGEASIDVPADQVKFTVVLESSDTASIEKVYQKHRVQEEKLVKLLQELQLPAADISYSLFSLNRQHRFYERGAVSYFAGRQTVNFTLSSVDKLSDVQARLIRDGFVNFNSHFTSTKLKQHQTEVLERAVEVAKEKAAVLAKASDRSIKRIVKVADTEDTDPAFRNYRGEISEVAAVAGYSDQNLLEFPQTIPLSAVVKVVFELR